MKKIITDFAKASVTKNSNKVQMTSTITGLGVGDTVIVSQAKPGHRMPGIANWPEKVFTTKTAMNKDKGQANKLLASNLDDKGLYLYDADFKEWVALTPDSYYLNGLNPVALVAKITAMTKNKRGLTLDKKSFLTDKNCLVHVENSEAVRDFIMSKTEPTGEGAFRTAKEKIVFPKGKIPLGKRIEIGKLNNVHIEGSGNFETVFFSPNNAPSVSFEFTEQDGFSWKNIVLQGNHRKADFGFTQEEAGAMPQSGWPFNPVVFVPGLIVFGSNCVVENVKMIDCFYPYSASGKNMAFRNFEVVLTEGQQGYTDWPILMDGCDEESVVENGTYSSTVMSRAFEIAKGYGKLRNIICNNGYIAGNSGALDIDGFTLNISKYSYNPRLVGLPLFDLNQRLESTAGRTGGILKNITINNDDPVNLYMGIALSDDSKNVTIENFTYNKADAADPGLVPMAIRAVSEGLVLKNIKVTGKIGSAYSVFRDGIYTYIGPDHATIGVRGPGKVIMDNVEADFIAVSPQAELKATNIKGEVVRN